VRYRTVLNEGCRIYILARPGKGYRSGTSGEGKNEKTEAEYSEQVLVWQDEKMPTAGLTLFGIPALLYNPHLLTRNRMPRKHTG
jgi:hypothetical protein